MPERSSAPRSLRYALLAATSLCAGTVQSETVSFASDVQPILDQYCVMCHVPGAAQGNHSLYPDAWKSMVNVPSVQSPLMLVEPGKPDASYTYLKLTGEHLAAGGSGEIMPFQSGPLSQSEIDTIRTWIEQGAEKN